jgi:EAL domain-containing protein (putative c-di-GMP-specific phosphodiesterase class I)/AmiR/NasT family two-component response regulator
MRSADGFADPGRELNVLVVDDDPSVTRFLERTLLRLGARSVRIAVNGAEALAEEVGADSPFDLIFCDLQMPELDGIAFLRHLGDRGFPGAVLLVSGAGERLLRAVEGLGREHDLEIVGVLEKPIGASELGASLEKARVRRSARRAREGVAVSAEDLRAGIAQGHVSVALQPQADAGTGRILGLEALVRWTHPEKGFVPPSDFIPVAEATGLIDDLTGHVLFRATAAAARIRAAGFDVGLSVNVSVRNLQRLRLPEEVEAAARAAGFPLDRLVLEVTESAFVTHLASTLEILSRLRLKGVGLSLDDFGTGYATLEHLQKIPFTELKVDRGFVNGAPRDPVARSIVESSVFLARKLGLFTVAEGVETDEEWNLVSELGVQAVQGYRLARPLPEAELLAWLRSYSPARDHGPT